VVGQEFAHGNIVGGQEFKQTKTWLGNKLFTRKSWVGKAPKLMLQDFGSREHVVMPQIVTI